MNLEHSRGNQEYNKQNNRYFTEYCMGITAISANKTTIEPIRLILQDDL